MMLPECCLIMALLSASWQALNTVEIHADGLFKLLVGALGDVEVLAGVGFAEVVDQHVEAAFLGDALVDHASVRGGVVCLKVDELGLTAAGSGGLDGSLAGLHVAAGIVDLRALIDEQVCDRAADAAGARRDQRDFSFQTVTHNSTLPFRMLSCGFRDRRSCAEVS